MKIVGEFNKVSETLRPPKLKHGEIVQYQFLLGTPDAKIPGKINYPSSYRIKTFDRVYDPVTKNYVDVGVYDKKTKDPDGNEGIRTKAIYLTGGTSSQLALTGGTIEHEELYEFLELSNQNESNLNRDTSVVPKFKRIDVKKDAISRLKKLDALTEALTYARGLSDKDVREFAAAMGWGENNDIELLQDQVGEFARTKPDAFIQFVQDPEMKDKALLQYAITKGIITYDVSTNKILWGGKNNTVIAALERQDGKTYIDMFSEWIRVQKGGDTIMSSIKKQLNTSIKEAGQKPVEALD